MQKKPSLFIIFLVVFIDLVGFGIVIPILPYYATSFGASARTLGWLMASYSAMQFFCAPLWGRLSDRIGRKPVLVCTIAGSSAALAYTGLAQSLAGLFIGRLVSGLFAANISTASAYIADATDESNRAKGMGLIGASFGLGFIFGPAIGGTLSRWGFGVPLLFASGMAALNALFALWKLREPFQESAARERSRISTKRRFDWASLRLAFGDERSRLAIAAFFMTTIAFTQLEVTFAIYMKAAFGMNAEHAGWYLAFMGIVMAFIQGGMIGRLSKKFGERRLIEAGTFLMAIALVWFSCTNRLGVFTFLALGLIAIGNGITNPSLSSLASKGAALKSRGVTMGVYQSAGSLARILGPVLAGLLYDVLGRRTPFLCASGIMIASCLYVFSQSIFKRTP